MESLWQHNTTLPHFEPLRGDISVDVLVIGGGLAGLLTAYKLTKEGIDCVLVEKGKLCSQTTAHTTAKITSQHGLIYQKILKSYGEEYAKAYYIANQNSVKNLVDLCREAGFDIEIKNLSFTYPDSAKNVLENLSLTIKQGEHIALIGGTGSGKSTLLYLLYLRHFRPFYM